MHFDFPSHSSHLLLGIPDYSLLVAAAPPLDILEFPLCINFLLHPTIVNGKAYTAQSILASGEWHHQAGTPGL